MGHHAFIAFLGFVACAWAAPQETEGAPFQTVRDAMTVVYKAEDFHTRDKAMAPILVYDAAFLQRFEPLSVGDILKRLPGIAGSADAGEFERPQLRGIGPQYTQILINGERAPGSGNDRTLAVDRIPAHLVERVEIMRAPSAADDAQGVGGTINIVLKDGVNRRGFDALLGASHFETDSKRRGQSALSYSAAKGNVSFSIAGALHRRHNPKTQQTEIVDAEGEALFKDEANVLDADETGATAAMRVALSAGAVLRGRLSLLASERREREDATFAADGDIEERIFDKGHFDQDNWHAALEFERPLAGSGALRFDFVHHALKVDSRFDIGVVEDGASLVEEVETDRTEDRETALGASVRLVSGSHLVQAGLDLSLRERDARARLFELDDDDGLPELEDYGGVFRIEERRIDAYVMDDWTIDDRHALQLGLRLELTELDLRDAGRAIDEAQLFPSLHYRLRISELARIRLSLARTTKRPDFMDLQPFRQRDQPFEGRFTLGNPDLKPEYAVGVDLGYERRFRNAEGMLGVNLFYRDIADVTQTVQRDDGSFQAQNAGDGEVYGLELDLGLPLTAWRLPKLSLFANLTLQESRLTDPFTGLQRAFNQQPDSVVNLGFIQAFPAAGFSFGGTWLTQGESREVFAAERAIVDYGDHLELLLEKTWRSGWSLRFTARNLLDAKRTELIEEYEALWTEADPVQTGYETERAGRSYFLVLRGFFGDDR